MSSVLASPAAMHIERSARLLVEAWGPAYGIDISVGALTIIHAMIRDGVQKMVDLGEENDHVKIFRAHTNLSGFLFHLTENAKAGYYSEIEQQHVENTQSRFCPVYPFS